MRFTTDKYSDYINGSLDIGPWLNIGWDIAPDGYVAIILGGWGLEIGQIDQDVPGVHLVRCTELDCHTVKTLLPFK